jgi:hypothetical protein
MIRYCHHYYKPSVVKTVKLSVKSIIVNHLHEIDIYIG